MQVNKSLVEHLAKLSKLQFNEQEQEVIIKDLNSMIAFVEKIDELDLNTVEPLVYVHEDPLRLREDVIQQTITREDALFNAPLKDSDYMKVPKVIKKDA